MTHPDSVEAERVGGWLYRQVVKTYKGEVGIQGGTIIVPSTSVYGLPKGNSSFSNKPFPCPWIPDWLPGTDV